MLQRILILAIFVLFVSCEKEVAIKEFPVITTLNPRDIDSAGATFRGELIKEGDSKTTSYGFIWGIEEPTLETSHKVVLGSELTDGIFEERINYSLAKGFNYKVRTFSTYSDKTVYGNVVTFLSKGSEKSIWAKEITNVSLDGEDLPYGWAGGEFGYVIFQDGAVFRFDPAKNSFSRITDFTPNGDSGTKFTAVNKGNIPYVFSKINNKLNKLDKDVWSVESVLPFYYGGFGGYYHSYFALNQIFILSSYQSYSFNLETNQWLKKSLFDQSGYSISGTDVNDFAYLLTHNGDIQRYNPLNDDWQHITTCPGNFEFPNNMISFSHDNKLFFGFSDYQKTEWFDRSFMVYDLTKNTWSEIEPLPEISKFNRLFYFFLNEKLYIFCGYSGIYSKNIEYESYTLDTSKL